MMNHTAQGGKGNVFKLITLARCTGAGGGGSVPSCLRAHTTATAAVVAVDNISFVSDARTGRVDVSCCSLETFEAESLSSFQGFVEGRHHGSCTVGLGGIDGGGMQGAVDNKVQSEEKETISRC